MDLQSNCPGLLSAHAAEFVPRHFLKIEKKDTLSQVLDRRYPNRHWRLWGKNAAIAQIAKLNPHLDINRLEPGMVVDLGPYYSLDESHFSQAIRAAGASAPKAFSQNAPSSKRPGPGTIVPPLMSTRAPAAVPALDALELTEARYGRLEFQPRFFYSRIDGTDLATGVHATYLSNLNPGAELTWAQHWSARIETELSLGLEYDSFETQSLNTSLDRKNFAMTDVGVAVCYVPFESASQLKVRGGGMFKQGLFIRGTGASSDTMDVVVVPELSLGASYRLFALLPFKLDLSGNGFLLLPAQTTSYTIQSGYGYNAGLRLTESLSPWTDFFGGLNYSYEIQNSSIVRQSRTDLGLVLGIRFSGGNSKKGAML